MDIYEKLVGEAVTAIRNGQDEEILAALNALQSLAVQELVGELCVCVEDVTAGKDIKKLLAAATIPLPENPEKIIKAVNRNSIRALHRYSGGDLVKLLASMLQLIASLQEAGERI